MLSGYFICQVILYKHQNLTISVINNRDYGVAMSYTF